MNIFPLGNRILVKQIVEDEISRGGIVMNVDQKKINRGIVCAIGPLVDYVHEEDEIFFGEYAGSSIANEAGEEFLIITEDEVLAVLVTEDSDCKNN